MSRTESESEPQGWYCVRAQVRREPIAAEHLRRITGVEVFAPRIRYRRSTQRGPVWFEESLFPGYLFAAFSWAEVSRLARHAPGVTGFVQFGGQPSMISDADIQALRRDMPPGDIKIFEDPLQAGETAVITTGPLQGLQVVVQCVMPAADRIRALLEFLGQSTELVIERKFLERVPGASTRKGAPS